MTVQEFIDLLQEVDDKEREVVVQRDSEGNGYSPLADVWEGIYVPECAWSGEAYTEDDGADQDDGLPALFLIPTN